MNVLATGLAILTVVLIGIGLLSMSAGNLGIAGVSFLSVSVLLYLRETRALDS